METRNARTKSLSYYKVIAKPPGTIHSQTSMTGTSQQTRRARESEGRGELKITKRQPPSVQPSPSNEENEVVTDKRSRQRTTQHNNTAMKGS